MIDRVIRGGILVTACTFGVQGVLLAAGDPLLGTWKLDPAKSTFVGAAPADRTMTFEKVKDGIRHTIRTTGGGRGGEERYTLTYTFNVDGKDYKPDVSMPLDSVSFHQLDSNTVERDGKDRGRVIDKVVYKISPDGSTMTMTEMQPNGREVEVYKREKP
jgi:hypothetical protein